MPTTAYAVPDDAGRHRRASRRPHRVRVAGRSVAALVSVGLLAVSGYSWIQYRNLDHSVSRLQVAVGGGQGGGGSDQNILVVGNDERSSMTDAEVRELKVGGRSSGSLSTDAMMIVHVPADGSRATLVSLPRDTVVHPKGFKQQLLNGVYASGYYYTYPAGKGTTKQKQTAGANLLIGAVADLTGIRVDHYVQVGLLGFYRLAKIVDGIPVTLCDNVDDRQSTNAAMGVRGGSGFYMSKGRHTLTPLQSLEFVRQRHNLKGGDLARVKRQQYFLTAAFREVASVGVVLKFTELSDALKRSIYVDDDLDLLTLARQLNNLTANHIVGRTIPVRTDADGSIHADPAAVRRFVHDLLAPASAHTSSPPSRTSSPTQRTTTRPATAAPGRASSTTAPIDLRCIR